MDRGAQQLVQADPGVRWVERRPRQDEVDGEAGPGAGRRGEALGLEDRGRAADEMLQQAIELRLECRIVAGGEVGALELLDRLDQRLGDVAPAELAEVTARVRIAS